MPITTTVPIIPFSQEEFHALDYRVTGLAFKVHSEFGRLCDEKIYQKALALRCLEGGLEPVVTEAAIRVSHKNWEKTYYVDLLVGNSVLYEFKTARALTPKHTSQALNYLLISGLHHGKLLNWRAASLEREFVSTTLTFEKRRDLHFDTSRYLDEDDQCHRFRQTAIDLVSDLGGFLSVDLYRDALMHLVCDNGNQVAEADVVLYQRETAIGSQRAFLLNDETAVAVSAVVGNSDEYAGNLLKWLKHTKLRKVVWMNLDRHRVALSVLRNN